MLQPLAEHAASKLSWVIGTNLFAGFRPEDAQDECVTLLERSGENPDFYLTDKIEAPIQCLVRSTDYHAGRGLCLFFRDLYHGESGIDLPVVTSGEAFTIQTAECLSGPLYLGQDERGRHEFSVNMLFRIQGTDV